MSRRISLPCDGDDRVGREPAQSAEGLNRCARCRSKRMRELQAMSSIMPKIRRAASTASPRVPL